MTPRAAHRSDARRVPGFALAAVFVMPVSGFACETCIEDQIAATYDHAVVAKAEVSKQLILYAAVRGKNAGTASSDAKVRRAIASVAGVDRSSIRVSAAPPAASFAWDAKRLRSGTVLRAINSRLAGSGLALVALQTFG